MGSYRKHWLTLIAVLIVTFSLLGYYGARSTARRRRFRTGATAGGKVLYTQEHPRRPDRLAVGGGMQLGSIWGHGAYQAPDWTADWLHRELTAWLDLAASVSRQALPAGRRRPGRAARRLKAEYRGNTFDAATARRCRRCAPRPLRDGRYYDELFSDAPRCKSREHFAMKENTLPSAERRAQMAGFFFWTAWAAATERPADVGGSGAPTPTTGRTSR
jgi:nitric oxide reductase subunit B